MWWTPSSKTSAARPELLITVDRDLLVLQRYGTADTVKPGEYWERRRNLASDAR